MLKSKKISIKTWVESAKILKGLQTVLFNTWNAVGSHLMFWLIFVDEGILAINDTQRNPDQKLLNSVSSSLCLLMAWNNEYNFYWAGNNQI